MDMDDMDDMDFDTMHHGDGHLSAMEMGTIYALYRHGQDRQADRIAEAIERNGGTATMVEEPTPVLINVAEGKRNPEWDEFIGQEPMKNFLRMKIASAQARDVALGHTLLASGKPGVGKTKMARLIAGEMGASLIQLPPNPRIETVHEAVMSLPDKGILFIDEIHKMAENGPRRAEALLQIMEEKRLFLDTGAVDLNDITVIGATTDADKLPEALLTRFPIRPYVQDYTIEELARITMMFTVSEDADISPSLMVDIALACRGMPREARNLVELARDMAIVNGAEPTRDELLAMAELDPDGMTRQHKAYLTGLYKFFARERDEQIEYVAGEMSMMNLLRETRQGIARLERFLMERGLLDRVPSGRRLTDRGIIKTREYIARGEA